jgi:Tfp pilus assembly protein PilF
MLGGEGSIFWLLERSLPPEPNAMDDHIKQLLLLGREHYAKREYDKAEPLLRQVAKHTDRLADVFDMLGVIAHSQGVFTLARDWFERALVLNPNYTEAQLNLMVTLNDIGDYAEARKLYGQLKKRGGPREAADTFVKGRIANMHAEISQAYSDVGMQVEAIQELEKAVSLCPNFPDLRTRLGVQYRDAGDRVRALEQFERATEENPEYLQARLMLGVLHLSGGDHEAAEREFAAVLDRDPGNTSARMYRRVARSQEREQSALPTQPPPADGQG